MTNTKLRYYLRTLIVVLITLIHIDKLNAQISFRTVALSGQQAPGAPSGAIFDSLSDFYAIPPVINSNGRVAFDLDMVVGLGGVTTNNDVGFWSEGNGALSLVTRGEASAPGTPAGTSFELKSQDFVGHLIPFPHEIIMNNLGQTLVCVALSGPTISNSNRTGIWLEENSALTLVAREGDIAPDAPAGSLFAHIEPNTHLLNNSGQVAFFANLKTGVGGTTSSNDNGLWAGTPGALKLIAREGSQAPGVPVGGVFMDFNFDGTQFAVFNSAGQIAFDNNLVVGVGGVTSSNDNAIWAGTAGALTLIAREGNQAPGTPAGAKFTSVHKPSINASGLVAFSGHLLTGSGGVTSSNDEGIWVQRSSGLSLAVREGDQAPGTPIGAKFSSFGYPKLSGTDRIAFYAGLIIGVGGVTLDNNEGMWTDRNGTLSLVAREGDQAPGMPTGVLYEGIGDPNMNFQGFVAVEVSLKGTGINTNNDHSIWAQDPTGAFKCIVREGDSFQVSPGDVRTISIVYFPDGESNSQDGHTMFFNDNFTLAFGLRFTDGTSGIFAASIPEPSSIAFLVCGAGMLVWKLRRKQVNR